MGADDRLRGAALPKARQWLQFLEYHRAVFPTGAGWIACFTDTVLGLHHQIASAARRLRGNPEWDVHGTMTTDTAPLEWCAQHLLQQLEDLPRRDIPSRFHPWHDSLLGVCRQHVRLMREIDALRRAGALQVDVTLDRAAQRLVEAG